MDENLFVTHEQCEGYRNRFREKNEKQDITLAVFETEIGFVKKIMYSILGVLISGFAGTIFAVLSIG